MINQKLIELFLDLASIDALSQKEKPIADFISEFLSEINYRVEEDNSSKYSLSSTNNLICKVGTGGDRLLLSHMDTARPTKDLVYKVENDRITSDGNTVLGVDNRAGIAVLLYLLKCLKEENIKHKDFTVAFTTCEETTLEGSKNLTLDKNVKMGFVFDSFMRPGNFITSSYGAVSFKSKFVGKSAHSGIDPENGINALLIANEAIDKIRIGRINENTTVNIGKICGGTGINVVPEEIEIEGEIRSADLSAIEDLLNEIKSNFSEAANNYKGSIEFNFTWDFKPYSINKDHEVYKEIYRAIKAVNLQPNSVITPGGSDANSLNANGISSVNIGIGAQNPHSNDEFILLEDLQKSFEIALALVKK